MAVNSTPRSSEGKGHTFESCRVDIENVKLRQLLAQAGIDAAEQKVTEGLQRLLLEELHHRIKVELALTLELSETLAHTWRPVRTNWKNHRDDKIIGNCSGCNTPQLLDTYRILCPSWYWDAFDGRDHYTCGHEGKSGTGARYGKRKLPVLAKDVAVPAVQGTRAEPTARASHARPTHPHANRRRQGRPTSGAHESGLAPSR